VLLPAALWLVSTIALPLHTVLEAHEHLSCEGTQGHFHAPCPLDPDSPCPGCDALSLSSWSAPETPTAAEPVSARFAVSLVPLPAPRAGVSGQHFQRGPPTA